MLVEPRVNGPGLRPSTRMTLEDRRVTLGRAEIIFSSVMSKVREEEKEPDETFDRDRLTSQLLNVNKRRHLFRFRSLISECQLFRVASLWAAKAR